MRVSQPMKYKIFADATPIAERTEMPSKKVRKADWFAKFASKDIVTGHEQVAKLIGIFSLLLLVVG